MHSIANCKGLPLQPRRKRIISLKVLLIMKLTAFFIVACLHVSAGGNAQNITLSVKNKSLQAVFKEIRKQSGYEFFYNQSILTKVSPITVDVKNVPIDQALNACFKDQQITYEIIGKNIVIKEKDAPARAPSTAPHEIVFTPIHGKVFIADNAPAAGATVSLKRGNAVIKGTTTD